MNQNDESKKQEAFDFPYFSDKSSSDNQEYPLDKKQYATKVFVGGLPRSVSKTVIYNYFKQFGLVQKVLLKTLKTSNGKVNKGFCFVNYEYEESAICCLNQTLHFLEGVRIEVKPAIISEKKKNRNMTVEPVVAYNQSPARKQEKDKNTPGYSSNTLRKLYEYNPFE